jgi:tryptophan-rich sensory protein
MRSRTRPRRLVSLIVILAVTALAGALASVTTLPQIPGWYAGLAKPAWTPPNAVFAPAWTALYLMMSIAAWLAWHARDRRRARAAIGLYLVQLVLNAAWSVLFFGMHLVTAALVDIALLWLLILATTAAFNRVSRTAPLLMVPYILWVAYAASLNAGIWWLER